jgi:serine/threonine-protein kinase
LASGGNGLVYAATDRTTEKRVAIKVLGPHILHARAAREKLRLEAIVAGRVESEHIVQVSDAGVDAATGVPFLVMELLRGFDLQHLVEEKGPLETAKALEYLRQVASGLDKAHAWKDSDRRSAPIVHRDLKPENLFLTHREDGTPLVKILDFGLAKVLSGSATLSSEVRGTPLYMAPEQLLQAPVTPATDIWAVGLIAFFLLTGKCYWRSGQNNEAVLPAVLKEVGDGPTASPQARLREFGVELLMPPAFEEWFRRCVNLEPSLRFQTAGAAVRALGLAFDLAQKSLPTASDLVPSIPRPNRSEADGVLTSRVAGEKRSGRIALLLTLGLFFAAGLALIIGKSRMQPAPSVPSSGLRSSASADGVTPPIPNAPVTPIESTSTSPSPPIIAKTPFHPSLKSTSSTAAKSPAPIASSPRNAAASKLIAATPVNSVTSEPVAPPRAHRDPADHR